MTSGYNIYPSLIFSLYEPAEPSLGYPNPQPGWPMLCTTASRRSACRRSSASCRSIRRRCSASCRSACRRASARFSDSWSRFSAASRSDCLRFSAASISDCLCFSAASISAKRFFSASPIISLSTMISWGKPWVRGSFKLDLALAGLDVKKIAIAIQVTYVQIEDKVSLSSTLWPGRRRTTSPCPSVPTRSIKFCSSSLCLSAWFLQSDNGWSLVEEWTILRRKGCLDLCLVIPLGSKWGEIAKTAGFAKRVCSMLDLMSLPYPRLPDFLFPRLVYSSYYSSGFWRD